MQVFNKLTASALFVSVLMLVATVGRAGVTVNTTVPYDGSFVFIPCANDGAGEMAEFTGPLHILFTFTMDANGGIHGKFHFQPMGLIATGEDTGDVYRATGESQGTFNTKVGSVTTFNNNFNIIGPGTGNNFLGHENLIVVIDAGGNVIVDVAHITADCK